MYEPITVKKRLIDIILALVILLTPVTVESAEVIEEIVIEIPEEIKDHPYKPYAYEFIVDKWGVEEWEAFEQVIKNESGWIVLDAHNPLLSSAYGLGGFLNATWGSVGCIKSSEYKNQIECTAKYVENRYGTPTKALEFHRQNNWY